MDTAMDTVADTSVGSAAKSTPASAQTNSAPPAPPSVTQTPEPVEAKSTPGRGRKPSTARKTRAVELTLTVTGTADGEWQAELVHQGERVVPGLPVAAAAVARAARELHPDVYASIDSVLRAAREQHRARLEELEAELGRVRLALADLAD